MKAVMVAVALALALALGSFAAAQPMLRQGPATDPGARPATGDRGGDAPDRRPFYVVVGIVVLGTIFWWNRRRRAELERESEDVARRSRARARAARGVVAADGATEDAPTSRASDDPDAADLRAAADAPDHEEQEPR